MTEYEKLLDCAEQESIPVIEKYYFKSERLKGIYCDGVIALNEALDTSAEKKCILAEELGHHYTAVGDITNQAFTANRKQETHGRMFAYNKLIGLRGIIAAYEHNCCSLAESAEYLDVTEEFLNDALLYYKSKYGTYTTVDNYMIIFQPAIGIIKLI